MAEISSRYLLVFKDQLKGEAMSQGIEPSRDTRIERAIRAFFSSPEIDLDFAKQCFWALKGELDNCSRKLARWAIFGLTFICIFELLNRKLIEQASLSFIVVDRLGFLIYVLPVMVAFSLVNVIVLALEQDIYEKVIKAFACQKFVGPAGSDIIALLISQIGGLGSEIPSSLNYGGSVPEIVITSERLSFVAQGRPRPLTIIGDGESSLLGFEGPVDTALFKFAEGR